MLSAQSSMPASAALDASSVALPARAMSGDEKRRRCLAPLLRGGSAGLAADDEDDDDEHEASAALPARIVS